MAPLSRARDPLLLYTQRHNVQGPGKRRLSIRPPHPSSSSSGSAASLLRFRGRRSKLVALSLLATVGLVGVWIVNASVAAGGGRIDRVVEKFREHGGFGKDYMGREEGDGDTALELGRDPDDGIDTASTAGGASRRKKLRLDAGDARAAERLDPDRVEGGLGRLCLLFPWRSECTDELELAKDPFRWYDYVLSKGRLFYPAKVKPFSKIQGGKLNAAAPKAQPHPIHLLIKQAKEEWSAKLKKQSKTLPQAIDEYEARYGRRPPRGFDEWYYHALANDFVLRDEFDIVDRFVTPFLAVSPQEIKNRHEQMQTDESFWLQDKTFTIELKDRGASNQVRGPMNSTNPRPQQMLKLLEKISHNLPNMNITFTGHDQPWIVLSGEARANHVAAARAGKVLSTSEAAETYNDWTLDGWANACPIGTPLRNVDRVDLRLEEKRIWSDKDERGEHGLIVNHTETMDLCTNPEGQLIHGFTSWVGPRPGLLYPIFSSTVTSLHSDWLIPPVDQYDYRLGEDPEWEDKLYDKVVWRGSTTGADLNIEHHRRWSQRVRLCRLPFESGSRTLPYAPSDAPNSLGPLSSFTARSQAIAQTYFDFAFTGSGPTQCDQDEQVCEEFGKQFVWDPDFMEPETQNEYKYVIDVDGNGWSGRFHRLMSSNSLVLKSTIFPEWYSDMVQPWLHYVPISTDYKDLWTVMAFFKGDEKGNGNHDSLAKEIASSGKDWTLKHWRWVDMEIYMWRVLLEYARIMGRDEKNLNSMDL
ncbi:hypothetical protein JCM11491_005521 [Sporobolomyces phaffii]